MQAQESTQTAKDRRSKADWFEAALKSLEVHGVDGVKVKWLARDLETSRSGFYWHFRDREDLLHRLLDFWSDEYTAVIADNQEIRAMEPREALGTIQSLVRTHDLARYDVAFQAWGNREEWVARRVLEVIRTRLAFVRKAFRALGFEEDDLEVRTRLFVLYAQSEDQCLGHRDPEELARLAELRLEILTKP